VEERKNATAKKRGSISKLCRTTKSEVGGRMGRNLQSAKQREVRLAEKVGGLVVMRDAKGDEQRRRACR